MTRAIILAAGRGTRLRPLTDSMPKCLVPLRGKPLLLRQIVTLRSAGVSRITVATGYYAERIEELGLETIYNPLFEKTNMVESLFSARKFLETCDEDLIISYGDIVYNPENLAKVMACDDDVCVMVDKDWRALWSLRLENPLDDVETLILDENGFIIELGKKPNGYETVQGQYTGLIKISARRICDLILFYDGLDRNTLYEGKDFLNMYMTSFIQRMIDAEWKVRAVMVHNGWLEVDTIEDLKKYETAAANGELDRFYRAI